MKVLCLILFLFSSFQMYGTWKVGALYNKSNLLLHSISYDHAEEKIKFDYDQERILIDQFVGIEQGAGLLLKFMNENKDPYFLSLDAISSHAVHWGRRKKGGFQQYIGRDRCAIGVSTHCARLFLLKENQEILYDTCGYHEDHDMIFDIEIVGKDGFYSLYLKGR